MKLNDPRYRFENTRLKVSWRNLLDEDDFIHVWEEDVLHAGIYESHTGARTALKGVTNSGESFEFCDPETAWELTTPHGSFWCGRHLYNSVEFVRSTLRSCTRSCVDFTVWEDENIIRASCDQLSLPPLVFKVDEVRAVRLSDAPRWSKLDLAHDTLIQSDMYFLSVFEGDVAARLLSDKLDEFKVHGK